MAETNRIWVRTSALDKSVYGKVKSSTQRSIPGAAFDEASGSRHWGWAKGRIITENDNGSEEKLEYTADEDIKILIQDSGSAHDHSEVIIKGSAVQNGDLVMDNVYGNANDDESNGEDEDFYESDEDDIGYENGSDDKYPDDLITLTHLHEPSVIYCLRKRYARDKIYTSTGPILIALNPFKNCKALYSEAVMKKYWERGERQMLGIADTSASRDDDSQSRTDSDNILAPHVYGIADDSFRRMMAKLKEQGQTSSGGGRRRRANPSSSSTSAASSCNQSILVSGESGAGKTVTTKFIMQYLATLSKRCAQPDDSTRRQSIGDGGKKIDIEQQVLQSNPILESFGNARTIRNDNSSRFGKFIEIQFTGHGHLAGASIETYLLEKVRLVNQTEGERNYHIFYELLEGLPDEDLDRYFLSDYTIEDFLMTNQSGTYDRRDGVNDYDTYQDLLVAMKTMGFSMDEQTDIMTIASAILHASNLTFNDITADESEIDKENSHLDAFLSLMGLGADDLNRALCYFSIKAGRETHLRSLSKEKAAKGLLALIKATYGALFNYVVKRVNESIASFHSKSEKGGRRNAGAAATASIGVLDIFGFESFKTNSFEQLCINYCNETLQQQFNLFVLKNEQEEYEREGIIWSYVSFPDNQDVLDLISKKGTGILDILDDQCRAPGTTDKTFINDLYQKLSRQKRFEADYRQKGARQFAIIHYAGTVEYNSEGFVEKNRDELPREASELLLSSSNEFLRKLAAIISGPNSAVKDVKGSAVAPRRSNAITSTVGGQFKRQLQDLRQKIDLTTPHYVRCLKPNDELEPDNFDPLVVADQLRCAGVIEAVKVSRLGYPQRYSHSKFVTRYRILGQQALKKSNASGRKGKSVQVLVEAIGKKIASFSSQSCKSAEEESKLVQLVAFGIQVGKTKVFLRREAFETIERLRNFEMKNAAVTIQRTARRYTVHREYKKSRIASITLQCFARTLKARTIINERRRKRSATVIQTAFRKTSARRQYLSILYCCKFLQRLHRGRVGRELYRSMNQTRKATVIQKTWKMTKARSNFNRLRRAIITIQCAIRCAKSRSIFEAARKAARDLQNTASERDQFRDDNKRLSKALADTLRKLTEKETDFENKMRKGVEDHKNELIRLQEELALAKNRCNEEKLRADKAETVVSESSAETERLLSDKENLQSQILELEELCSSKGEEGIQLKQNVDALQEELDKVRAGNVALSEQIDEKQHQIVSMEAIAVEKEQLLEETENLRQELNTANEDIANLRDEKSALETSLESAQKDVDHSETELSRLKAMMDADDKTATSFSTALESVKAENDSLSKKIDEQDKAMENLNVVKLEKEELASEVVALQSKLDQVLNGANQSLNEEKVLLEKVVENIRNELEQSQTEVAHLRQKLENGTTVPQSFEKELPITKPAEIEKLSEELFALRKQLEERTSEVQNLSELNSALKIDLENAESKLQESENARLRLVESASPTSADLAASETKSLKLLEKARKQEQDLEGMSAIKLERDVLAEEASKLRQQLAAAETAKEQLRQMGEELNEQKVTNQKLQKALEDKDISRRSLGSSGSRSVETPVASVSDCDQGDQALKDTEIANLKDIITCLKAELKAASESAQSEDLYCVDKSSAEEILTLQDEVNRLNNEITTMKMSEKNNALSPPSPQKRPENHQVSKLIDSIMAKDEEIRDLRREIAILRDQLDTTTISMLTESQSQLNNRYPADDDDKSVISRIFGRGQQQRSSPSVAGADGKELIQLRTLNEKLKSEAEVAKAERDELQTTLEAERERAASELAAFADALQGVDELRNAAEQMSREITRLKNLNDDEVPEDPFGDIDSSVVEEYENGVESFESAKRTIGTASLKTGQKGLWGKLRLNVQSLNNRGEEKTDYSRRRRRRDRDDDDNASIFSSFF